MKITKYGHCCLLIEIDNVRILTDPGMYSTAQNDVKGVDFVLISHEHGDHYHIDSVKAVLANNPEAKIVTNKAVAALLKKEGIPSTVIGHGQEGHMGGVAVKGWGTKHAVIWGDLGQVENTGYLVGGKLWYPGDDFTDVDFPIESLALPVAGPWMKFSEAIGYALKLKPKKAFPVHDAIYASPTFVHMMTKNILEKEGIGFVPLEAGQSAEL